MQLVSPAVTLENVRKVLFYFSFGQNLSNPSPCPV